MHRSKSQFGLCLILHSLILIGLWTTAFFLLYTPSGKEIVKEWNPPEVIKVKRFPSSRKIISPSKK